MSNCAKCEMPIDEDSRCGCNAELCYHCCECEAECSCGCKEKGN